MDMTPEHKILDYAQHLGVYIGGFFTLVSAAFGLWLHEIRQSRKDRNDLRTLTLHLKEHSATKTELSECRASVDKQDQENLAIVLGEIKDLRADIKQDTKDNQAEHVAIMNKMLELHSGD